MLKIKTYLTLIIIHPNETFGEFFSNFCTYELLYFALGELYNSYTMKHNLFRKYYKVACFRNMLKMVLLLLLFVNFSFEIFLAEGLCKIFYNKINWFLPLPLNNYSVFNKNIPLKTSSDPIYLARCDDSSRFAISRRRLWITLQVFYRREYQYHHYLRILKSLLFV